MTIARFNIIAHNTEMAFLSELSKELSLEELTYLESTPIARRNLQRRFITALSETLLSPDQRNRLLDLEIEDLQPLLPELLK